jgi:hypothetical protein
MSLVHICRDESGLFQDTFDIRAHLFGSAHQVCVFSELCPPSYIKDVSFRYFDARKKWVSNNVFLNVLSTECFSEMCFNQLRNRGTAA